MTLYKAINSSSYPEITAVEVSRVSDSFAWIDGRRNKLKTDYESYFPTRAQAREHLLNEAEKRVESANRALEYARESLSKVLGL